MVTLAKTQNFNEFELHLRAILGLPISEITQERIGASAVILGTDNLENPTFEGLEIVAASSKTDFRIFGKPTSRPYRRMGVVLTHDNLKGNISEVTENAKNLASQVKVISE
jgi:phosphoribosylglycinamide formyltransferase 2